MAEGDEELGLEEIADDAGEDAEDMGKDDELSEEQKDEMKENIKELNKTISSLKDSLGELKTVKEPFLKTALKFVGTTSAAAVVFSLVGLGLKKLIALASSGGSSGDTDKDKAKLAKTTALTKVLKKLRDVVKTLTTWMTDHKDDTIDLSGVTIPMVDYFTTEVDAMSDVSTSACQLHMRL
jgi:Mg2+ and Co2+ transporter CorA